jgi:hypothetical protein
MTPELQGGAKVFLRGCRVGQPGTVLGFERGRVRVYWHDLDFISLHRAASLLAVDSKSNERAHQAPALQSVGS